MQSIHVTTKPTLLNVLYEDIVEKPEHHISTLMNFINLEIEPNQCNPIHISNDKRAEQKEFSQLNKPINTSSVARWINDLSEDELNTFNQLANNELIRYGYRVN